METEEGIEGIPVEVIDDHIERCAICVFFRHAYEGNTSELNFRLMAHAIAICRKARGMRVRSMAEKGALLYGYGEPHRVHGMRRDLPGGEINFRERES